MRGIALQCNGKLRLVQRFFRRASAACLLMLISIPPQGEEGRAYAEISIPHIVTRTEWGADESLGIPSPVLRRTEAREEAKIQRRERRHKTPALIPTRPAERERVCEEALQKYPGEFRVSRVERADAAGHPYAWPRSYSEKVKLIVLHHTGENEDQGVAAQHAVPLTGPEHVRAIYAWHTVHNGWGDIGYHYLVDKDGVIYEGRAGGDKIIGAHAYCANTGTIGIALLGNFLHTYPTETQLKSLRWLLMTLSERYDLDLRATILFHGKEIHTIAMHKDLLATECPGKLDRLMPLLRRFTAAKDTATPLLPLVQPAQGKRARTPAPLPRRVRRHHLNPRRR